MDPLTIPVLIVHENGNNGSGSFLQVSNSVYLVTAKHVLFSEPVGTNPPALRSPTAIVKAYSGAGSTNMTGRTVTLDLTRLLNAGDVRFSTNRDVAMVRIEDCRGDNHNITTTLPGVTVTQITGLNVFPSEGVSVLNEVEVGADVYMFGYPTSLTAPIREKFDPMRPLLRKGIVAGVNLDKRVIIVDCPAYQGNSGGPVIQVEEPSFGVKSFKIIGLVSQFVPFQEEWENKTFHYSYVGISNSGYTIIEPIDTALELAWK
jgi:hypothetical protein